ncbi:hypothetical protein TNCV_1270131, partial [Trichonephila clavipes]
MRAALYSALRLESRSPHDPGHFQRLAQLISFLLLASMTIIWSDQHKYTGYMGWRLASRAICPVIAPKAPKASAHATQRPGSRILRWA